MSKAASRFVPRVLVIISAVLLVQCSPGEPKTPGAPPAGAAAGKATPWNRDSGPFVADWQSLRNKTVPQWLRDGKFGIYTHWGVYSVPACGENGTWYPYNMYREGTDQYKYHVKTYGPPSKFGYKDFIPMFKAEKFDPEAWADLFVKAGAKFAGPVTEHHDGFSMWASRVNPWNAKDMGPHRDVVGELERAIRKRGLKFLTAFHHAENWWFYPHWRKDFDTSDPRYAGLYGPPHDLDAKPDIKWGEQSKPSPAFLDEWRAKLGEVVDAYHPDFIWFDFALGDVEENYREDFLAYFYNKAAARGQDVVVTYKDHDLPPGVGMVDLELGQERDLTYHEWITDTSVDTQGAWSYVQGESFKTVDNLVRNLVDRVSKNGYLLLNVGPKADGTIPDEAKACLLGIGDWLRVNGEAIYGTTAWTTYGEGPTRLKSDGPFNEEELRFTAQDIRFTVKGDVLYAIALDWPGEKVTIKTLAALYPGEVRSVRMLGAAGELAWTLGREGLTITLPKARPCEHAFVFRIERGGKPS